MRQENVLSKPKFDKYPNELNNLLEQNDFDQDEELIIRREISTSGKSRAFINDSPTRLDFLQTVSSQLIDLNSQFEISDIQNPQFQLNVIDALADNHKVLNEYSLLYNSYKIVQKKLNKLNDQSAERLKEMDYLSFQLKELEDLDLMPNEQVQLEKDKAVLEKSEEIRSLVEETKYLLFESDNNIQDHIQSLIYKWQNFEDIQDSAKVITGQLENIISGFENLKSENERVIDAADTNPKRLQEIQSRLDLIYNLQIKHQVKSDNELIDILNNISIRLSSISTDEKDKTKLEKELSASEKKLGLLAEKLQQSRKKVFKKIENSTHKKLANLSMESAQIKVDHKISETFKSDGIDNIELLFKANKGGQFHSIKKVASGGERSRLMLAIKSLVAHKMSMPTMIFDEIDTGVSGQIAQRMGDILQELSEKHQIIVITHSPQVASKARKHFYVHKSEKSSRTLTQVSILNRAERITEIAKMLSGDPPIPSAIENAKELMDSVA